MVYAGNDRERIDRARKRGANAEGQSDQVFHAVEHAVLNEGEYRAENRKRQISRDQHGDERRHEEIDDLGHDLVQLLLQR